MAPPPAKRRRRNVLPSSSDDENQASKSGVNTLSKYLVVSPERRAAAPPPANPAPTQTQSPSSTAFSKLSARSNTATVANGFGLRSSGKRSASSSPEKSRNRVSSAVSQNTKPRNADLKSLFSRQAERAPAVSPTKLDDILSDPISDGDDDDQVGYNEGSTASRVGQNARKRFKDGTQQPASSVTNVQLAGSQKFLRPPRPAQDFASDNEQRPWSERFGPTNIDELAVHKKKVADVKSWFEGVMGGRLRQRLLVLKGAAGTGKTTTVRLLARDLRCELLEWKNPTGTFGATQGGLSASAQFQEFIGRSGRFSQLDVGDEVPVASSRDQGGGGKEFGNKIILIEEFPNTFARSSTALTSFRNSILQYLISNTPSLATFGRQAPQEPIIPVVLVISETLLTTTSASADSFTAHRLLGPEISRHPGTCVIEFNAIAPTILANALDLIVQKEARKSGRRKTPGPLVLKKLGEIGDIRSAISSLEFLCLKGDADADWGSKVAFTKSKRGMKNGVAMTKGEVDSLELISQREASLGIFHAVGKIVYNKREDAPVNPQALGGQSEALPDYLAHHSRPKRSEVSVDDLIDETGTDIQTFVSALHENYALSCEATAPQSSNSSLDYLNDCIDYLSTSDLLSPSWDVFFGGREGFSGRDSASHAVRQDEIAFHVATRGLLFSLPYPVKRAKSSGRPGGDAFKMFYPTSIKLWREKEELEGLVDHWATMLLKGDEGTYNMTQGASAFRRPNPTNGGDWISRQSSQRKDTHASMTERGQSQPTPLLSLGSSARREMLLERLPYMAHMARKRKLSHNNVRLREMEKVVSFSGIGAPATEGDLEGDETSAGTTTGAAGDGWATDKPTEESSPRKRSLGIRQRQADMAGPTLSVQKLVLSDDDIEDD